ncbi:MAG: type I-B CRISPR-associated protein Cas5b [Caldisericia bacterium]
MNYIKKMYILRLKIYQPNAHYRIPFTYQRRHTYPIPPYSTIIGLLLNILGIYWQGEVENAPEEYKKLRKIKISISGRFKTKTTEYIWYRNLSKDEHLKRFGTYENRIFSGNVEHFGYQMPTKIDILNDVNLLIHLAHKDKNFIQNIKQNLENPNKRLDIIHLGRAEDWLIFEEISEIKELNENWILNKCPDKNYKLFFWIPEKMWLNEKNYDFKKFDGLEYRITTFWKIKDFEKTMNRNGYRLFEFVRVKLNDGLIKTENPCIFDKEVNTPVFLLNMEV